MSNVRVIQRGQPTQGEVRSAFDYAYQPLLPPNQIQPPITPDYGAWAARNSQLLNGVGNAWRAGRPMAPTAAPIWHGVGRMPPHQPRPALFPPYPLQGAVQIQQSSGGSRHLPSSRTVVQDAFEQPHSRAPRLYGPSLGQALGDTYRW